jgi:hypothetical protein
VSETKFPRHLGFQDFLEEATGQLFYQKARVEKRVFCERM